MSSIHISNDDFNYVRTTLMNLLMIQLNWPSGNEFIYWREKSTLDEKKLAISILSCKLLKYEKEINKNSMYQYIVIYGC